MHVFKLKNGELHPDSLRQPTIASWKNFAKNISEEKSLTHYSSEIFKSRHDEGLSIVLLDCDNNIICHSSLIALHHIIDCPFPVYEVASGWTHMKYRKQSFYSRLRVELLKKYSDKNLLFTHIKGKGIANLLKHLNWSIIPWKKFKYASSLIGWKSNNHFYKTNYGYHEKNSLRLFNKETIDLSSHNWNDYYHLWSSNYALLKILNDLLQKKYNSIESLQNIIIEKTK